VNQKSSDKFLYAHIDHGFPSLYLSSDRSTSRGHYNPVTSARQASGGGE
jgi:hypothetical protein